MTLPVSGALSFNAINTETNTTATWQLSFNDERFRSLAGGSAYSSPVSLSVQYGATFNGFYLYPRQTNTSWNQTIFYGSRASCSLLCQITSGGEIYDAYYDSSNNYNVHNQGRWYTPITAGIASQYDFRVVQTGWTRTGTATNDIWGWQIDTNLFGNPVGGSFDSGWLTTKSAGYDCSLSQQRVTVNGSFDATATGTFQFRPKANTSNVVSLPFTFRIYAL